MEIQQDEEKGLILHGTEFTIDLKNVSYYSNETEGNSKHSKCILHDINVTFKSGHLTAILGPSGAGKTSLLNILSGFRTNNIRGSIKLNGQEKDVRELRAMSSYIPQEFEMHPSLTTRETLAIAASLKLSSKIGSERKSSMVNEILDLLGLRKVENVFVGKLSGGEKKRLSIAIELLTNPPIMLFDEPTSGLDSSSSYQVVTHLKSLAQNGRIIVCSIHQPSTRLFDMFDDVLLLGNGQNFYNGSVEEMTTVLEKIGFQCPRFYNRADYAIEVVSNERGDPTNLVKTFRSNEEIEIQVNEGEHSNNTLEKCKALQSAIRQRCKMISLHRENGYPVMFHVQFFILLKRAFLCTLRDLHLAWLRIAAHILVALLLGVMYYGMGDEASKTSSNVAYVFFFILFLFFSNAMPTVLTFPIEAAVFQREYLNNWYSLTAYYTSKIVAEIPLQVMCPTLFICSSYFLTSQPYDGSRLILLWFLCLLITVLAQTTGLALGAICGTKLGIFLVPASSIPMILFSGFFMKLQDFPWYLKWLTDVSYFRYAFEGAMQCIYGYDRQDLTCSVPFCFFKVSRKILEEFGMEDANYSTDIIALAVWIFSLQMCLLVALKIRVMMY